jgi:hypothetical protein
LVKSSQATYRRGRRECPDAPPVLCIERVHLTRAFGQPLGVLRLDPQEQAVDPYSIEVRHHEAEVDHLVVSGNEPGGLDIHESEKPPGGVIPVHEISRAGTKISTRPMKIEAYVTARAIMNIPRLTFEGIPESLPRLLPSHLS